MVGCWHTAPVSDVPWLQVRRGKEAIVGFFESMAPLTITRLEPHALFGGGEQDRPLSRTNERRLEG